jgi:hypothetical protein
MKIWIFKKMVHLSTQAEISVVMKSLAKDAIKGTVSRWARELMPVIMVMPTPHP